MSKTRVTAETVEALRILITTVVAAIVDHSDDVEVNIVPASYRLLAELHTADTDVGQVIGKNGHVAESIRSILGAFGGKHGLRVDLDYVTEQDKLQRPSVRM
jgi:predicted RNA-binding protein YlqC (UPF0109 family)